MLETHVGKPATVIVNHDWYETLCRSTILTPPEHSNPNVFEATLEDISDEHGIWVTPEYKFTGDRGANLMVPWNAIVSIVILGEHTKAPAGFVGAGSN